MSARRNTHLRLPAQAGLGRQTGLPGQADRQGRLPPGDEICGIEIVWPADGEFCCEAGEFEPEEELWPEEMEDGELEELISNAR